MWMNIVGYYLAFWCRQMRMLWRTHDLQLERNDDDDDDVLKRNIVTISFEMLDDFMSAKETEKKIQQKVLSVWVLSLQIVSDCFNCATANNNCKKSETKKNLLIVKGNRSRLQRNQIDSTSYLKPEQFLYFTENEWMKRAVTVFNCWIIKQQLLQHFSFSLDFH